MFYRKALAVPVIHMVSFPSDSSHLTPGQASPWVLRFASLIPQGETLDLACGSGRHAKLLASLGHRVLAVDRDTNSLAAAAGPGISTLLIDLESDFTNELASLFRMGRYAGIVATNYLHRPLLPHLLSSLAPGGLLIYETFAKGNERFGKPSNPDFLLTPGELLDTVRRFAEPLHVLAFEDGYIASPRQAMLQRICVLRPGPKMAFEQFRLA